MSAGNGMRCRVAAVNQSTGQNATHGRRIACPRPSRDHRRRCRRLQRRLPPRPPRLDRRGAAGAQPADIGHDVARRRSDHHGSADIGDAPGREAQHRGVPDARGRHRLVDGVGADGHACTWRPTRTDGRSSSARHRSASATRSPSRSSTSMRTIEKFPLLSARRLGRIAVLSRTTGAATPPTRRCRWLVGRASGVCRSSRTHRSRGSATTVVGSTGVDTAQRFDRGRVRDQLRRDVGPATRRARRRARPVAGAGPLLRRHRGDPRPGPRPADDQELRRLDVREERRRRPDGRLLRTGQLPVAVAAASPTARRSCNCPTTGITSGRSTRAP